MLFHPHTKINDLLLSLRLASLEMKKNPNERMRA